MNIAVNTRLLISGKMEGIGWYTHEILKRIVKDNPQHNFYFLFDRSFDSSFIYAENVFGIKVNPQARHPILFRWWFHHKIPRVLKKIKADVFFSPEGCLPLDCPVPCVNVIHDIGFEHFPEHLAPRNLKFYKTYFPLYASKATKIITVSEFSKEDIVSRYSIERKKVSVIYNGVRESLKVQKSESTKPFFVYVGTLHPRKNILNMLKAFDQFISKTQSNFELKLIGRKMGNSAAIDELYNSLDSKNQIKFLGYQPEAELAQILNQATAMLYLPLFEGFGMPILEAFQSDLPLLCSNNSSLPEVAADAALMVDATDIEEICNAMQTLSTDKELRNQLILKGRQQVKKFSWEKAAKETWKVIEECLD